jgi:hypothetical protein
MNNCIEIVLHESEVERQCGGIYTLQIPLSLVMVALIEQGFCSYDKEKNCSQIILDLEG